MPGNDDRMLEILSQRNKRLILAKVLALVLLRPLQLSILQRVCLYCAIVYDRVTYRLLPLLGQDDDLC